MGVMQNKKLNFITPPYMRTNAMVAKAHADLEDDLTVQISHVAVSHELVESAVVR